MSVLARMAGLEPATFALTVRRSTIELHPILEIRAGIEPASTVLQTVTSANSATGFSNMSSHDLDAVCLQSFVDFENVIDTVRKCLRKYDILWD